MLKAVAPPEDRVQVYKKNSRYVQYRGAPIFLVGCNQGWAVSLQTLDHDYRQEFDRLHEVGGNVVRITQDGERWGFPGGRPEGHETWEETLRREVKEEACVEVTEARLLGFGRGECIRGHEKGLVLVRSIWLANVQVLEWVPELETVGRKFVSPDQVLSELEPDVFISFHYRALIAAHLLSE